MFKYGVIYSGYIQCGPYSLDVLIMSLLTAVSYVVGPKHAAVLKLT